MKNNSPEFTSRGTRIRAIPLKETPTSAYEDLDYLHSYYHQRLFYLSLKRDNGADVEKDIKSVRDKIERLNT